MSTEMKTEERMQKHPKGHMERGERNVDRLITADEPDLVDRLSSASQARAGISGTVAGTQGTAP